MDDEKKAPTTIDEYISGYPAAVQKLLQTVRAAAREAAPEAEETISYGVPTLRLNGTLVSFGAAKQHIGFYPTPAAIEAFQERLTPYKGAKGSVQFPYDQPLPLELIADIVRFRAEQQKSKKPKRAKKA